MLDVLTLHTISSTNGPSGSPVNTVTATVDVFCESKGVKRAEYWGAQANGKRIDATFEVNADEYNDQTEAVYAGKTYKITRTYPINTNRIELICTRR
jgi:SPP1 family predicted phage head-tail adaptor